MKDLLRCKPRYSRINAHMAVVSGKLCNYLKILKSTHDSTMKAANLERCALAGCYNPNEYIGLEPRAGYQIPLANRRLTRADVHVQHKKL